MRRAGGGSLSLSSLPTLHQCEKSPHIHEPRLLHLRVAWMQAAGQHKLHPFSLHFCGLAFSDAWLKRQEVFVWNASRLI